MQIEINSEIIKHLVNVMSNHINCGKLVLHNGNNVLVAITFARILNAYQNNKKELVALEKDDVEQSLLAIGKLPCELSINNTELQMCDLYCALRNAYYSEVARIAGYGDNSTKQSTTTDNSG